jgi:hypothetical protein
MQCRFFFHIDMKKKNHSSYKYEENLKRNLLILFIQRLFDFCVIACSKLEYHSEIYNLLRSQHYV